MSPALRGDPASCSQVGGSLRRLAVQLRSATATTATLQSDLGEEWSGRVARTLGRGTRSVTDTADAAASELDRVGSLLQEHATDLAEALQEVRAVEHRVEAAGLSVNDGRVVPQWGVAGLADEDALAERDVRRAQLQAELDSVALRLDRRRTRLTAALGAAQKVLADHSSALRG